MVDTAKLKDIKYNINNKQLDYNVDKLRENYEDSYIADGVGESDIIALIEEDKI